MPIPSLASTSIIVDRPKELASSFPDWRGVVVVLGIIALSFPTLALPLLPSLDSSWMIGLHETAKRGFVYGRDVGFTYGPLGYILFPLNEGTAPTTRACYSWRSTQRGGRPLRSLSAGLRAISRCCSSRSAPSVSG